MLDAISNLFGGEPKRTIERMERETRALDAPAARAQFEVFVLDPERYRTVERAPTSEEIAVLALLPEAVQAIYSRYVLIEEVCGDTRLERSRIGVSQLDSGCVRVGTHGKQTELAIRPGSEVLYVLDASAPGHDVDEYPTIWHYLLLMGKIIYTE